MDNSGFNGFIISLSKMHEADHSLGVHQIEGGPITILIGSPKMESVVQRNRIGKAVFFDGLDHVDRFAFVFEFRCVDPQHNKALGGIRLVPFLHMGQGVDTVDAVESPEVDEHNLSF